MTHKIFNTLAENSPNFISGESIATKCGISRTAVKKHIDKLIAQGYDIEALKKSGYALKGIGDIFDICSLIYYLQGYAEGIIVEFHKSITSTNDAAKRQYLGGGTGAVVAAFQSKGKGRLGRSFCSEEGGVYVSFYTRLLADIDPMSVGKLTTIAAVAANRTCKSFGANTAIKWPNDIFCGTKKLGGILGETVGTTDMLDFVVMGIGINVNNTQFDREISNIAGSIKQVTGSFVARAQVAAKLIINIKQLLDVLYAGKFDDILQEYRDNCLTIGKRVRLNDSQEFLHTAIGTDHNGNLIIEDDNGSAQTVYYGDVSIKHYI